jgi:hypothetical protein
VQNRFRETHTSYCHEVLQQTDKAFEDSIQTIQQYVDSHREAVGVLPILPIME